MHFVWVAAVGHGADKARLALQYRHYQFYAGQGVYASTGWPKILRCRAIEDKMVV